jgi:hypothetical protein
MRGIWVMGVEFKKDTLTGHDHLFKRKNIRHGLIVFPFPLYQVLSASDFKAESVRYARLVLAWHGRRMTNNWSGVGIGFDKSGINPEKFRSFLYPFLYIRRAKFLHYFQNLTLPADTEKRDHLF